MTLASRIGLGIAALGAAAILDAVEMAKADDVPDALSVEWQGKRPCSMTRRSGWSDARSRQGSARLPLTPGLPELCGERRPRPGPGRERNP
jgi:hypothetical protein